MYLYHHRFTVLISFHKGIAQFTVQLLDRNYDEDINKTSFLKLDLFFLLCKEVNFAPVQFSITGIAIILIIRYNAIVQRQVACLAFARS